MKPEIKFEQQPLTPEEIRKHMNFDKFIGGYSAATTWLGKGAGFYAAAAASAIAIAGLVYYMLIDKEDASATQAFINPPVADIVVKPDVYEIDANRDTTLRMSSGTTVFIPAGSFADASGAPVSGKLLIHYREFHDQVDFIFSGIPMNYDTAGTTFQFESAGMFEISASQHDKALALKQGKEITVNMISYNAENYFNVYFLDTVQRQWVYDAANTRSCKEQLAEVTERSMPALEPAATEVHLAKPQKADPAQSNFVIDYKKDEFPELAVYDSVRFEISPDEKNFDPKLAQVTWEFVEIRRHDEKHYKVIFGKKGMREELLARPVFDEKSFAAAMDAYERQRRARIYAARKANDSLSKAYNAYAAEAIRNNDQNAKFDRAVKQGVTYRAIVVNSLGIWNCDHYRQYISAEEREQIVSETKTGIPDARFVRAGNGERVWLKGLFLFKRSLNAIYGLSGKDLGRIPLTLVHSADVLVAVAADYSVLYMQDAELKSLSASDGSIVFSLKPFDKANKDLQDLKARLRI